MHYTENENSSAFPVEFKNSENKTIRTVMVNDEPLFVAKDVFDLLDIHWDGKKSLPQIPDHWRRVGKLPTLRSGLQPAILINEAAVFKIAFRSNKPEADRFTDWVAGEVLPQIRKNGIYSLAKPVNGIEPVIFQGKAWYNYLDILVSMGYSRRSGSVAPRKAQFPQHFLKLFGRNFISYDFCAFLKQRRDAWQLTLNFASANRAVLRGIA